MSDSPPRSEMRLVCAGAVPGGADAPLAAALRAALDWDGAVELARREGTAAILLQRLDGLPEGGGVPARARGRLRAVRAATLARNLVLLGRLADADRAFAARGLAVTALKGAHLVRAVYGDPGLRGMGDLDLLVEPRDVPGADEALRAAGFAPEVPVPRRAPERGLYLNSVVYFDDEDRAAAWGPACVHLHWHWLNTSFPVLPYGVRIRAEALVRGAAPLPGCRAVAAPAPEAAVVHLCEHAFKHSYDAIVRVADVAALWQAAGPEPRVLEASARRWGLERPVGLTLGLAGAWFGWEAFGGGDRGAAAAARLAGALLDGGTVTRAEQAFRRDTLAHRRGGAGCWPVYLAWQPGAAGKLAFVARTLFPPPEDLRRIEALDRPPRLGDYVGRLARGMRYVLGTDRTRGR